ncbi:MAG: T9SS type A sorting domain-containing protein, partial [Melioribacteraceae bacterium]
QAIFKSTDSGNTWTQFNQGLPNPADVGPIGTTIEYAFGYKIKFVFAAVNNKIYKYYDQTTTNIKSEDEIAYEFQLSQNYPNPFNPTTTISFLIPRTEFVSLKVYDLLGREVATLVNEEKLPGHYEVEFNGMNLPSGVYFYRLQAGNFSQTKKLLLLK